MMRIPTFTQFTRQAETISKQFDQLSRLQSEAASGKRINNASDDPLLASQINTTEYYIDNLKGYEHNGVIGQNRGELFSKSIQSSIDTASDIQNIIIKARNGDLHDTDRLNLSKLLKGDLSTLLNLSNYQDSDGKFIYSGSNGNLPAFLLTGSGYQYQGGFDPTTIDIGMNASMIYSDSGNNVFGNIPVGNGYFTVSAGATNTGVASTSPGSVLNGSYTPDTYTVTFVTNSAGQLAYQVTGLKSGQVEPKPPLTTPDNAPAYVPGANGMDIVFNGVNLNINGNAHSGDTFVIQPSVKQDVFTTIQGLIDTLEKPITNQGSFDQALSQASASMGQVFDHFLAYQSEVGIRNSATRNQIKLNNDTIASQTLVLGKLSDADMAEVFSKLSQQSLALQVTQQSYLKIQETLTQLLKM